MLVDGRQVPDGEEIATDVCIIGAGAAGISIALELAGREAGVCLVESGGFAFEEDTQRLYEGEVVGRPYFPLHATRMRYFGGTTNHWAGEGRPLDPLDFETRSWVPRSGWPIDRASLDPYYRAAHDRIGLGRYDYDVSGWEELGTPLPLDPEHVLTRIFQQRSTQFGPRFRDDVVNASNIRTFIHSNVVELETRHGSAGVTHARIRTFAGNAFSVVARVYILACGGLENPRVLLASRAFRPAGLGNEHDLVGRFFMEHPHIRSGGSVLPVSSRFDGDLYLSFGPPFVYGVLALSPEEQRRNEMLNFSAVLRAELPEYVRTAESSDAFTSFRSMARGVRARRVPDGFTGHLWNVLTGLDRVATASYGRLAGSRVVREYFLNCRSEQAPNPESRVSLIRDRDALGMPKISLDWRLSRRDLESMQTGLELLARAMGTAEVARVRLRDFEGEDGWEQGIRGGHHHMGTTRMAASPLEGVVDEHCKVHSLSNLYVAGSSVFPTVGYANPTLTIVALAIRLAEHVNRIVG